MSARTAREVLVDQTIGEMAGGATTVGLYGPEHPRAGQAVQRLAAQLGTLLADEPELAFVLLGEELFVQGRPFTRISRHAASLIRRFRRRGLEHVTVRSGVTEDELRGFLGDLVRTDEAEWTKRPHILAGRVELAERELGGPDEEAGGQGPQKLTTVRDRVALIHECFSEFTLGRPLAVGGLALVVRALYAATGRDPDPVRHFAPWEGEERWGAVHAHNVAALTVGLARLAGAAAAPCQDLGIAALTHDLGKLSLPPELLTRELELSGDELELLFDHPRDGLAAALENGQLPPVALLVAFEHHLNYNGTGYPRLGRPRRPHPAARLVTLADAFDVLFTSRGGRGLLTREGTLAWLEERSGTVLDPAWVGALRRVLEAGQAAAQPPG